MAEIGRRCAWASLLALALLEPGPATAAPPAATAPAPLPPTAIPAPVPPTHPMHPTMPGVPAPAGPPAMVAPIQPPPVAVPAGPSPEPVDDKAGAIARDVATTRPQKQVPQQDASRLRTSRLTLGGLLDRPVHGAENSEVGRVIDVMVGEDGQPAALELDVGGFMGVGNRRIAVAWALFDLSKLNGSEPLRVALTEAQVKSAPAADGAVVAVVTGADLPAAPRPVTPATAVRTLPAASTPGATGSGAQAGSGAPAPHGGAVSPPAATPVPGPAPGIAVPDPGHAPVSGPGTTNPRLPAGPASPRSNLH